MNVKMTFSFCLALLFALLQFSAFAQPPNTIVIQGQLLDSSGGPLLGSRQYVVKFFDAAAGGLQLGATLTDFTLVGAEGLFAIPVVIPQAALDAAEAWYELTLDSAAPLPDGVADVNDQFPERVRVHSVPFAHVAAQALQVEMAAVGDGSITQLELSSLSGVSGNIQTQMDAKAATTDVYVQSVIDSMLALKADATDVYTKSEVDTSQSAQDAAIALKADAADVYIKSEVDSSQAAQDAEIAKKYEFQWQVVTSGPVQAVGNRGYVINSATEITVTLPDSGVLAVGDVVRLSGMGVGGWRLAQNAGQQILTQSLAIPDYSAAWTPRDSNRNWRGVASSADGTKLVAVVYSGQIYTSTDSGANWIPRDSNQNWVSVASSADGAKLVAGNYPGQIYTSTDSGISWTARESSRDWNCVASSADGTKLVAVVFTGQIYTSTDSGLTWFPRDSIRDWQTVASSADGTKLVAAELGGQIYTSTDSGLNWIASNSNRFWTAVASSADGNKLVAVVSGSQINTSTDSGLTWTPRDSSRGWFGVASSADGSRLVAMVSTGLIYTSTDSGVTWSPRESNRNWLNVASSSDGTKLVAPVNNGQIYTYQDFFGLAQTTAGTTGVLTGSQHSAVELQYIGNDTFVPLSHEGSLGAL